MSDEEFNSMQEELHQEQKVGHIGSFIFKWAIGLSVFVGTMLTIPFGWCGAIAGCIGTFCSIPAYKGFKEKEEHAKHEIIDNKRSKEFIAEADRIIATVKYNHSHAVSVGLSKSEEQETQFNDEYIV
jgi:hypothetical protein